MNARAQLVVATAAWLALTTPARALDWDAQAQQRYGGRYSTACADPSAPRLRANAQGLAVEAGGKRMTGTQVDVAVSYFGPEQKPGEQAVALLSQVRGGRGLIFAVHMDRTGQYVELDGDPQVLAALGKGLTGQRFLDCDAARSARVAAAALADLKQAEAGTAAAATTARSPAARTFKSAYLRALGANAKERWLTADIVEPGPDDPQLSVAGVSYRLISRCKPHDCGDNNIVVLFAAGSGTVYAKLLNRRVPVLLGSPPPAVATELDKQWRAAWRQGQ